MRDYDSSCGTSERYKYENVPPAGKLIHIKVTYVMECVGLDVIGQYPLTISDRFKYVLVIINYFITWVVFVRLRKTPAKAVASDFLDNFVYNCCLPDKLISDSGSYLYCISARLFK